MELTHLDSGGNARMVDVADKAVTRRRANATGSLKLSTGAAELITAGSCSKGDVLGVARTAAIMAVKRTCDLIPLCHQIPVSSVNVHFDVDSVGGFVRAEVEVTGDARTGFEMEAMTGVSVALLTVYDMLKAVDRGMAIEHISLQEKSGGIRGNYQRSL
ncbi:MAG: cyclic pyranopterin monophosphate synthase MoaC [Candidatus Wallbacteria bacterium HGW-Wallbacteria-1]|jgi:cyclic pyranopterin phosphate synthase|uniref:Cyclic pyranopterin monophosphate synthase n=1 Tax=Candidatus Wallbacteria bacterium HGW-Wallbacteria-1 TaxID=2013854 RepID=A0A2N1PV15_9BACT|nr:MAG: cyclic pyranopterin monophosphate synthase MoaC [Candidatus Wallbacteria bacterium HGW-Wallbacteria-1]